MTQTRFTGAVVAALLCVSAAFSDTTPVEVDQAFISGKQKVRLLELYTSEGCSSCPPADAWFATLLDHPGLWRSLVPVAFHVDYWNYLGWADPLSNGDYSQRQRAHKASGGVQSVYTPGFVLDGQEWRGWFSRQPLAEVEAIEAGTLVAYLKGNTLEVTYNPANIASTSLDLHVALLGFNISNSINRGENRGKTLVHQFAVLKHLRSQSTDGRWQVAMPDTQSVPHRQGLAIWVTPANSPRPLQATGGWLQVSASTTQ